MNLETTEPVTHFFPPDGEAVPNHPTLPVLIYRSIFHAEDSNLAQRFEEAFQNNGWTGTWRWSVYDFHHFHCDAHEALGVSRGSASLLLGGPQGRTFEVAAGDLIVLPAGTGHKNRGCSRDFQVVGAYPQGQAGYTTNRADPAEYEQAVKAIAETPLPSSDPVFGEDGPLTRLWKLP